MAYDDHNFEPDLEYDPSGEWETCARCGCTRDEASRECDDPDRIFPGSRWKKPSFPVPTIVSVLAVDGDVIAVKWGRQKYTLTRAELLRDYQPLPPDQR